MARRPRHLLDTPHFQLLGTIHERLADRDHSDPATLAIVNRLLADADPDRYDRLEMQPAEPAVLVERMASWAIARASDPVVHQARSDLATPDVASTDNRQPAAQTSNDLAVLMVPATSST